MVIDCHNHLGAEISSYLRGEFPYAQHFESLVREGRAHGVDRWIVFPMTCNFSMNLEKLREGIIDLEGGLEDVPYAFENRRMMREITELFPEEGRAAIPFAFFDPWRETAAQIEELRKLGQEYRIFGLKTQTTMIQSPITSLTKEGRGFLELAEEWDVPLLIHSSVLPEDKWAQARDILDIAEANPQVRFNAAHSCRFDREMLDRIVDLPNTWFDCSAHGIHCQLAVTDHPIVAPPARRFDSDYTDPARVLKDLAEAYPEKMMWGSDSPYHSFVAAFDGGRLELMSHYSDEADALNALPMDLKERVTDANIRAWLGAPYAQWDGVSLKHTELAS